MFVGRAASATGDRSPRFAHAGELLYSAQDRDVIVA
jgi:hypothetical protein